MLQLTDKFLQRAPVGEHLDTLVPGFGVRVTAPTQRYPRGRVAFFVRPARISGRRGRVTLGYVGTLSLARARELAREVINDTRARRAIPGRSSGAVTVRTLAKRWTEDLERRRCWSVGSMLYHLERHALPALEHLLVGEVKPAIILELLDQTSPHSQATRSNVRRYLHSMFAFAVSKLLIDANPVTAIRVAAPASRERVLSDSEVAQLWRTLDSHPSAYVAVYRLLLLTGQRRGEVLAMQWNHIDGRWWTITENKSSRPHRVHLSGWSLEILNGIERRGPFVHPSQRSRQRHLGPPTHYPYQLREELGFEFRLHDLRRTVLTGMASLGVAPHIVSRVANHAPSGVTRRVYDRYSYDREAAAAWDLWSRHVRDLVTERAPANVLSFSRGTR